MSSPQVLTGFRSIEECLRSHPERILRIAVSGKPNFREEQLLADAAAKGISIEKQRGPAPARNHDRHSAEILTAYLKDFQYDDWNDLIETLQTKLKNEQRPVVLVLDGITDPHNLGAIIRTAAFTGVDGIVLPKDRSVSVTDTVHRISSGGTEYVSIVQVTNIASALTELKDIGFWIVGFSEHSKQGIHQLKRDFNPVIVIGNEEKGMRPLVKDKCDFLVQIQGAGRLKSLNASVAAAIAMTWASGLFDNS